MNVELINTGTELLLGRTLNTHQQWLCRELTDLGYVVTRQVTVADNGGDIEQAVREALARAELVLTTGGLGPTSDDLTRELIAKMLGKPLHEDPAIVEHIQQFFVLRKRPMPASTRTQAQVPEGALVLHNVHGTAPGLALAVAPNPFRSGGQASWLIMLPGPPRELRPMFKDQVVSLLKKHLPPPNDLACRTLLTSGLGESAVQEKIGAPLGRLIERGLDLGYCARVGQVEVRLSARGNNGAEVVRLAEAIVRQELGPAVFGEEEDELESVVIRLLTERKQTLALAESCTGGCLAHRLTNVPGASAVLLAGLVTYANEAKKAFLGVRAETLAAHGAVSEPAAREMAEGARRRTSANFALAVTGIAGPSGGAPDKPVGTAFIALATPAKTTALKVFNPYDRETFKQVTAKQALDVLRRTILDTA